MFRRLMFVTLPSQCNDDRAQRVMNETYVRTNALALRMP